MIRPQVSCAIVPAMTDFVKHRGDLDGSLKRRFFFRQGSEIYGGVAGFYTYGPPGCALKTNMLQQWRNHFVIEEQMMEIEDTNIMPRPVLKASGHVDRFSDFLVRDSVDEKKFYRADKLLEDVMDAFLAEATSEELKKEYNMVRAQADAYSKEELVEVFEKYKVVAPESKNKLTEPEPFNLMFPTPIGPSGKEQGYLRPETAQGIFLNYKFCLEQNANKMPFGIVQVGKVFRNEIAPRGFTRLREFSQAEIEWFVKPTDKSHPKFKRVKDLRLQLHSAKLQLNGEPPAKLSIGHAVETGLVNNETLGYFMARTFLFLKSIGIRPEHCRFRQHLPTEMAHYACDCWDAEIETSSGWLECVGIADRACFDLNAHAEASNSDLAYRETLETPIEVTTLSITKKAGIAVMKAFKKQGKAVKQWLEDLPEDELKSLVADVGSGSAKRTATLPDGPIECEFLPEHVETESKTEKQTTVSWMPGVVEPSFGVDRILWSMLEHTYYVRSQESDDKGVVRSVFKFPASIAPYKLAILPLDQRIARDAKFVELAKDVKKKLGGLGHSSTQDDSNAAIGRRYARNDELGIPFAVTFDFQTLEDATVTLRERVSMTQVRMPAASVASEVHDLCTRKSWEEVQARFSVA